MRGLLAEATRAATIAGVVAASLDGCADSPIGWTDENPDGPYDCGDYESNLWCTSSGGYGANWNPTWGHFDYTRSEVKVVDACCACGGGVATGAGCVRDYSSTGLADCDVAWTEGALTCSTLEEDFGWDCEGCECLGDKRRCADSPEGWQDSEDFACDVYASAQWCTPSGGVGTGWMEDWGSFSDFQAGMASADEACCGCGGGERLPTPPPTSAPTPAPTRAPTPAPTVACQDYVPPGEAKWHNANGARFDCAWHSHGQNCALHGALHEHFGATANEACCACAAAVPLEVCIDSNVVTHEAACTDSSGATDDFGDSCDAYQGFENRCGGYDDEDFTANYACCTCGGGAPLDFVMWRTDSECIPNGAKYEKDLGYHGSAADCQDSCVALFGYQCNYFLFGKGDKFGSCWYQVDSACTSGYFEEDEFDIYKRAALDASGNGCDAYTSSLCDVAEDDPDFTASLMCCACGGGGRPALCLDSNGGATDRDGHSCTDYVAWHWCFAGAEDDDFTAVDMCCFCEGGIVLPAPSPAPTPAPTAFASTSSTTRPILGFETVSSSSTAHTATFFAVTSTTVSTSSTTVSSTMDDLVTACLGDPESFDAGYGPCDFYAFGQPNHQHCNRDKDVDAGLTAWQVCEECGSCRSRAPESASVASATGAQEATAEASITLEFFLKAGAVAVLVGLLVAAVFAWLYRRRQRTSVNFGAAASAQSQLSARWSRLRWSLAQTRASRAAEQEASGRSSRISAGRRPSRNSAGSRRSQNSLGSNDRKLPEEAPPGITS